MADDVRLTLVWAVVVAVLLALIVVPMPGETPRDPELPDAPDDDFAYWQALRRRDGLPEAPDPLLQAAAKPKKARAAKQARKPPPPPPPPVPPEKPKATKPKAAKPKKATAAAKAATPTPVAEAPRAATPAAEFRVTLEPRAQPIPWRAHEAADAEWFAELDVLERKLKEAGPRPRDEL